MLDIVAGPTGDFVTLLLASSLWRSRSMRESLRCTVLLWKGYSKRRPVHPLQLRVIDSA
ncbi:MAG: hypothetical protein KME65_15370 [Candidatus Thiodiazotropha sp. (ex Ctena orbiculata)]|uniref:Uncharacterized protein n=1 Tax=Candidatus Thiodiazotropha taylori TaxID=2792791 RepID=A0A944QVT7_9GAMM|nr:hypothetical protein [Candidatus Thiodiazotropha taylori]MBV2136175.1 hypothetical protein [Candidatus Thiodiazotropha taylori]